MKIFVIGATGYIGSVVAERLRADGHVLSGLARSDASVAALSDMGVTPVRGAMGDTAVLARAARDADAVVQIATGGFLAQALETVDAAMRTTDVILDALAGTDKPYLYTGGTGMWLDTGIMVPERVVTEADPVAPPYFYAHLVEIYRKLMSADAVRTIILAPGQLYGRGGGYIGPIARLFNGVRQHGFVAAVAPGDNAFTYVHVDDLADLYALALNAPDTRGLFIGATDTVPQMEVARAVSRAAGLGGEVELVDYPTMRALNGRANELDFWLNCRASSDKARTELGWQPHRPGVIDTLAQLPAPLDLGTVYPEPKRQAAASQVSL
ncbi:NAD-dependent epimerase/dehydratase family protein [Streptomyces sp. LaPpAH-108]|uniref:NAD-dependent epimerase/dehydratase family protein n=1 Tax=Streptomyces sp. LaPpAH-108 TaxID=1155714 RepID=UPI0003733DF9|nr:NAD-dependent epimerase/dehydratase family protein [Streptomyces sp. LaPpAH-108]